MFNERVELAGFLSLDGTIIDANERSLAMIGATRSEITGRAFWDTPWWEHDAALQERLRAGIARAAKGEFVRFEAQHPRSDGVMAIVDFSLTPIRAEDGAVEVLFAESVEITDQRRAESELRDSEERFRTLATNVPVAIFQTDPHGECLYVNPRWCELAGLSEDEARGRGWTQALHPDDRDRLAKEWDELTAGGLDVLPLSDRRFRTPDGRVTWLAGSAVSRPNQYTFPFLERRVRRFPVSSTVTSRYRSRLYSSSSGMQLTLVTWYDFAAPELMSRTRP